MERPILFNTEMVRAILDGRKTQTRRLVKPRLTKNEAGWRVCKNADGRAYAVETYDDEEFFQGYVVPPVQRGDVLWVRETWQRLFDLGGWRYEYKADYKDDEPLRIDGAYIAWRPSIHMPRGAARLFLKVTSVRVQRLRDITSGEAVAEGIESNLGSPSEAADALIAFEELWNSTVKPADQPRYGWGANPWVWVIEFERCEKP